MFNFITQLRGLLLITLLSVITACGSDSDPYYVTEVQLSATQTTFADGESQLVEGIAIDSTGKELTASSGNSIWTSQDDKIATVDYTGLVTGVSPGTTIIYASYSGSKGSDGQPVTGSISITITKAVLVGMKIYSVDNTVVNGLNVQYTVFGIYGDGTEDELPNDSEMHWASSLTDVAEIDGLTGLTDTIDAGETTISVTFQGLSSSTELTVTDESLVSIVISPSVDGETSVADGYELSFTAEATYTDDSKYDVTQDVDWYSSVNAVLYPLEEKGEFEGVNSGNSEVTATLDTITSNEIPVIVTDEVLVTVSIKTEENVYSYPLGSTKQLIAQGYFSDNTEKNITDEPNVTWSTDAPTTPSDGNPVVAIVDPDGTFHAEAEGDITITVNVTRTDGEVISDTQTFTVTDAELISIKTKPTELYLVPGQSHQYIATGLYTDGTTRILNNAVDIVWSVSGLLTGADSESAVSIHPQTGLIRNYFYNGLDITEQVYVGVKVGDISSTEDAAYANLGAVRVLNSGNLSFTGTFIKGDVNQLELSTTSYEVNPESSSSGPENEAFIMLTLAEADAVCTDLVYNNHRNYRLPTYAELMELWDDKNEGADVDYEFYTKYNWSVGKNYWTSTTDDGGTTYKVIDLGLGGEQEPSSVTDYNYVSCVRTTVLP